MEILIIFLAFMLGSGGYMAVEHLLSKPKAIPTKYDPHYTRKLEQQEFGYILTTCDNDDCAECFPKAITKFPSGAGKKAYPDGGKPVSRKCDTCKVPLDSDGWCSNGCTSREFIQKHFEDQLTKANHIMPLVMAKSTYKPKHGEIIYDANRLVDMCGTCGLKFTDAQALKNRLCPKCVPAERYRTVDNYRVRVPDNVPDNSFAYADYAPIGGYTFIIWKWMDKDTGRQMFWKSMAPQDGYSKRPLAIGTERIRK